MDLDKHTAMANAIRMLAAEAVEAAKSGHPGLPMGAADIATVLFTQHALLDPAAPEWPNRDRFVLSAGHGSMLLYAVLYLLGYEDFGIEEIKRFRQLGARTAGHPEYGHGRGIETTTGPLGQGIATAVGIALSERMLNAEFGDDLVNHYTFVLASDGDLMEGVSHEAISIAGHLCLKKLIVIHDDNGISIDGPLSLAESGDQVRRFEAAGWRAVVVDGHDPVAISNAIAEAKGSDLPTYIAAKTEIGRGAPEKAGTASVHGAPLGAKVLEGTRKALGWTAAPFEVPSEILDGWRIAGLKASHARKEWQKRHDHADPEVRAAFDRRMRGDLPAEFEHRMGALRRALAEEKPKLASRKASERVLATLNTVVPEMVGGSADLTGSNNTKTEGLGVLSAENYRGRYVHWGVREHGMAAAMNGLALSRAFIPYGGTFLAFSDYCRPAIRMAAMMGLRVVYVMTHDSIGLGEDGPTHQPVEHLAALRAMPNLVVLRPADAIETCEAWEIAVSRTTGPTLIALTRQDLPVVTGGDGGINRSLRGAYEIEGGQSPGAPVTLFASGSEVEVAAGARDLLKAEGIAARVVSVPSFELFSAQDTIYQRAIIGQSPVKIAIEAGVRQGWDRFIGSGGTFVGMSGYGASAPYRDLYAHFGITPEAVARIAKERLSEAAVAVTEDVHAS